MIVRFPTKTFYLEENEVEKIPLLKDAISTEKNIKSIDLKIGEEFFERIIKNDFYDIELTTETEQLFYYFGISIPERLYLLKEIRETLPKSRYSIDKYTNWQLKWYLAVHTSHSDCEKIIKSAYIPMILLEIKRCISNLLFQKVARIYCFIKRFCGDINIIVKNIAPDNCTIETSDGTLLTIYERSIVGYFQGNRIQFKFIFSEEVKYYLSLEEFFSYIFNLN